jgi:hypothetical protein
MLGKSDQKKTQNRLSVPNLNVAEMDKAAQRLLDLTERHGRKDQKKSSCEKCTSHRRYIVRHTDNPC